jgi:hypothetical protein
MTLALNQCDLDQAWFIEDWGMPQDRPGYHDLVFTRELADQSGRRVRDATESSGEIDTHRELRVANEIDQNSIEYSDVSRPQNRGFRKKEIGDAARSLAAPFGVADSDDLIEFKDKRRCDRH